MSPYVSAVIFFVVLLFIPISLLPLVDHSTDKPGWMESKRIGGERDDQRERMESGLPEPEEISTQ